MNIFPQDEEILKLFLSLTLINKKNLNDKPKESIQKTEESCENTFVISDNSFTSWENFHKYLKASRKSIKEYEKLNIHLTTDDSNFSFNYNFVEIHDQMLQTEKEFSCKQVLI